MVFATALEETLSFKYIPGDYHQKKLVERMPRMQRCHQDKGWLFEESQI
jgi:hypothetical protein